MGKKLLIFGLFIFLIWDAGYSFLQHYNKPLDGDLAAGVVPAEDVGSILKSPLGTEVFTKNEMYPNPNRFFSHWSLYAYFNNVPFFLQHFTDPVNAAYLSAGLIKIMVQLGLILMLVLYVTAKFWSLESLIAAAVLSTLFQTNGYQSAMGIIDPAITYVFFYALPALLLMAYFYPIYHKLLYDKALSLSPYFKPFWIFLALVCSLSGPLNSGIALIVSLLVFTNHFQQSFKNQNITLCWQDTKRLIRKIPHDYYFYLLPVSLFSIYSLYLGTFTTSYADNDLSLISLYRKLPAGILNAFTKMLGYPILILILIFNFYLIKRFGNGKLKSKLLALYKWTVIFTVVYIILLPLGGYRDYRPFLLRYDTLIPVTLMLIFLFARSFLYLAKVLPREKLLWYLPVIIVVLVNFAVIDEPVFGANKCERVAIDQLKHSDEKLVKLENDCTVLSWSIMEDPNGSAIKTRLLKKWNILEEDKLFYQVKK